MKRSSIFWGLILVLAAGLLLLKNFGIIQDFFSYFWLAALMFLGIWLIIGATMRTKKISGDRVSIPLDEASGAYIKLDHGAGRLKLSAGNTPGSLLDGEFYPAPVIKTKSDAGLMRVEIKNPSDFWSWLPGETLSWDLAVAREIPIELEIDSGASTSVLDLRDLKVTSLDLDTGASTTEIFLPVNAGQTHVKVDSGAATIKIHVPKEVPAQIRIESGMASIRVAERFPKIGKNTYLSPDYSPAANRADISIETGMASVEID